MTDDTQQLEDKAFKALDANQFKEEITPAIEKLAEEKAEKIAGVKAQEIAEKLVGEKMADLGKRISGEKSEPRYSWEKEGRDKPKDWSEAMSEAERIADQKAEARLNKWKEEQESKYKYQQKLTSDQQTAIHNKFSRDFYDLQRQGALPTLSEETQKRINFGETLSDEDRAKEPALRAFEDISTGARRTGKTFKEYYYEDYKRAPAGSRAPVWGGASGGVVAHDDDYTYDEIDKLGKQVGR